MSSFVFEHFEHLSDLKSRAGNKCATLKSPSVLHLTPSCFWEKETGKQKLICLIWKWKTLCAVIISLQARALVALCWANTIPTSKLFKASKVIRSLPKPTTLSMFVFSDWDIKILKKGTLWSPSVPHRAPSGHNHLYVKHHFTHHSLAHFVKFSFCNLYFVSVFMSVLFCKRSSTYCFSCRTILRWAQYNPPLL